MQTVTENRTRRRGKVSAFLTRLIDYFMHPDFYADVDRLYRARVLAGLVLFCIVSSMLVSCITLLPGFTHDSRELMLAIELTAWFCLSFLLVLLRNTGMYRLCSISVIVFFEMLVIVGIALTGGIWTASATQLLCILPLLAYFFGGIRWGNYSLACSLLIFAAFLLLEKAGIRFTQLISTEQHREANQLMNGLIGIADVSCIGYIYELTASRMRRDRDRDHNIALNLAQTDALTGLGNRRSFDTALDERISRYARTTPVRNFALCYIDLDGFKPINDRYGHKTGDEVLQHVARRLRHMLRNDDCVARIGGDEFAIILNSCASRESLAVMAERALNSISQGISTSSGSTVSVGASIGFALFPLDADNASQLKKLADAAMYKAKKLQCGWLFHQPGGSLSGNAPGHAP